MKTIRRRCLFLMFTIVILFGIKQNVKASETTDNINVTIPTSISVIFEEDGTNQVSDFVIQNATTVPLTIHAISLTECNDWRVVSNGQVIPVNTKELVFKLEEQCLNAGQNTVEILVPEKSEKALNIQIARGAWTYADEIETAFELEIQYSMPEVETTAYALYLEEDTSLRFVRSAEEFSVGDTYDGKTIEGVYTGFEEAIYESEEDVPWYDSNFYSLRIITQVIFEDEIKPVSTAYWFCCMYDCESINLSKLDTSQVTNMAYMFGWTGYDVETFGFVGIADMSVSNVEDMQYMFAYVARNANAFVVNLSNWDVSKVKNMYCMFMGTGYSTQMFGLGDLSIWDVSNAINVGSMFRQTGYAADWSLDCSGWDVSNVTYYNKFHYEVESKVIAPEWVN